MTEYEKVEKLCEKANVSYEEAKAALEESNWDLLDAIVLLEKQGKIKSGAAHHSTKRENTRSANEEEEHSRFSERVNTLGHQIKRLIEIGNNNHFVIHHKGKRALSLPITAMVLLLLISCSLVLVALVVGLFFGLRYSVEGEQLGKPVVNDVMDKAANAAENVRETVEDSFRNGKNWQQQDSRHPIPK